MVSKRSKAAEALARALSKLEGTNEKRIDPAALASDKLMAPYPGVTPAPAEVIRHWQEMRERRHYTPAPIVPVEPKPTPTELKWYDYVDIEPKDIRKRDLWRLEANWNAWTTPVQYYGIGENRVPLHIFFSILEDNGASKQDFDWKAFREHYFALHPQQRAKFEKNRKEFRQSEKGKRAKRAYDRKRQSQRRKETRERKRRGGLF